MKTHHAVALALAAVNAVLLVVDTVVVIMTGKNTWFLDDDQGTPTTTLIAAVVLGLAFAAMAVVVVRERSTFAAAPRPARLARPVLLTGLVLLGTGFLVLRPVQIMLGIEEDVSGLVALLGVTAVSLASLVIGLASLRDRVLGTGGRVLGLLIPTALITAGLYFVAPAVASPAYCTLVALVGIALLGVGGRQDARVTDGTRAATAA